MCHPGIFEACIERSRNERKKYPGPPANLAEGNDRGFAPTTGGPGSHPLASLDASSGVTHLVGVGAKNNQNFTGPLRGHKGSLRLRSGTHKELDPERSYTQDNQMKNGKFSYL
jgi:hypothetical protein